MYSLVHDTLYHKGLYKYRIYLHVMTLSAQSVLHACCRISRQSAKLIPQQQSALRLIATNALFSSPALPPLGG